MRSARVSVPGGKAMPLRQQPVVVRYQPVCSAARAGPHTGCTVNASSKATPSAAKASNLGVTDSRCPNTPHESGRC